MTDRQNYLYFMLLFEPVCGSKGNPGLFSTGFPPPIERLLRWGKDYHMRLDKKKLVMYEA